VFRDAFLPGRGTPIGYGAAIVVMTAVMAGFHALQERRRPAPAQVRD